MKALSYFELIKAVIEQKTFSTLAEMRAVMAETSRTGLKMVEW